MLPALVSTRDQFDGLFAVYVPIALGVFVVVLVALAFVTLRYRRRAGRPEFPGGPEEHNPLEGSYAVLLAAVVGFLLYLTFNAEHKVDTVANRQRPNLIVDVTASKWEWDFRYPAYQINARSGEVGRQPLVVPANRAIRFNLRSQDVIHSLWIPELRFKRDLIHGTVEHVTLTFTRTGTFSGQCAEYCGLRHSEMVFTVHVLAPATFARWASAHRGGTTA